MSSNGLAFVLLVGLAGGAWSADRARPASEESADRSNREEKANEPFYRYCSDVRAAGVAPLYRGQPGYASHLDRDNDGVACEPYRR